MDEQVEIVVSDKYVSRGGFGAAQKNLRGVETEAKKVTKAAEDMNDEITNGFSRKGGTRKITSDVDKLGGELGRAGRKAGEAAGDGLGRGMGDGFGSTVGDIKGMATGAFSMLPGIAAVAGGGAAALFAKGFEQHFAIGDARAQLKAQFAMTTDEAASAGKTAGDLYAKGVGETIGATTATVGNVTKSFKNLSAEGGNSLANITKGATNIGKVFDTDVNSVIRSAAQLLKTGLEPSAESALDTIVTGFQKGMDVGGDFLDTIDEYSPFFKRMGLSAREGLGLINQFLEGGARNADFAADAIKEFSIRAIDGSKTTVDAYKAIGLDADLMAQKIAAGGPVAKEAFGEVVRALQGIQDPIAQNTAGVGLFGTQWEDTVREILPGLDMTKDGFEGTAGSVDKMNKSLAETDSSKLAEVGRKLEGVAEQAAKLAIDLPKITGADKWFQPWGGEKNPHADENNKLLEKRASLTADATTKQNAFSTALDFGNHQMAMGIGNAKSLSSAESSLFATQSDLVKGNQLLTEATGNNQAANLSNLDAFVRLANGGYQVADSLQNAAVNMDEASLSASGTTVRMDALGNAIISIPGHKPITVTAETLAADNRLSGIVNRLAAIQSKTVTITTQEIRTANAYSSSVGGKSGYDHGGITSTAATGGVRGGSLLMNERAGLVGGEHVRLPNGSTVLSPTDSRTMENRWAGSGGGAGVTTLEVIAGSSSFEQLFARMMREFVRVKGHGNVTKALGGRQ